MGVPDFQTLMLPLLQLASDRIEHSLSEAIMLLADHFGLSEAERDELIPSGRQARFANRVGWASTYLRKAGLLESTRRGWFVITDKGLGILQNPPERIDLRFLKQYPEIKEFRYAGRREIAESAEGEDELVQTPEEILYQSYQELREGLAQELLETVKRCSPRFFEQVVLDLLIAMGYGGSRQAAAHAVGGSGDGGIDGIINEDKLGLDVVYVQAKRWDGNVGRPQIQAFAGSLEGVRARKGVFITTSAFTQDALDYVKQIEKKIVLINGRELAQLMIDHNVGVSEVAIYSTKRIDLDYV